MTRSERSLALTLSLTLALAAYATPAAAQADGVPAACTPLLVVKPAQPGETAPEWLGSSVDTLWPTRSAKPASPPQLLHWLILQCGQQVNDLIRATARREESFERNQKLMRLHQSFHDIERWRDVTPLPLSATSEAIALAASFPALERQIHDTLRGQGLRNEWLVSFVPGFTFGVPAGDGTESTPKPSATTYLELQSKHAPRRAGVDWGIGGRLGVIPGMVLKADAESDQTAATSDVKNVQQAMFAASIWLDTNVRVKDVAELSVRLGTGFTSLLNTKTTSIAGSDVLLLEPIGGSGKEPQGVHELGVHVRFFGQSLDHVHEFQSFSTPQFQVGLTHRWDRRLKAAEGSEGTSFYRPGNRLVFSLGLHDIPVSGRSTTGENRVSLNLALEYEAGLPRWWRSQANESRSTVPSTLRLMLGGNIDLAPLFKL